MQAGQRAGVAPDLVGDDRKSIGGVALGLAVGADKNLVDLWP